MEKIKMGGGSGKAGDGLPRRPPISCSAESDTGRAVRRRPIVRVWQRPGAGAVPTRSAADPFDFSGADGRDRENAGKEANAIWVAARQRAFRQLDEWLVWSSFADDESVFPPPGGRSRNARVAFVLKDVIADPVDVLHYSLRTFSVFL